MKTVFLLLLASATTLAAKRLMHGPDIALSADWKISGKPSTNHSAEKPVIEIEEADQCSYRQLSSSELQLGDRCVYLSGVYHYLFQPQDSPLKRQVVMGFSVSRPQGRSRVFMVSPPIVLITALP